MKLVDKIDLIRREDAIRAVEKAKTARSADGEIFCAKINAQMNIQHLPSVQTKRKKGKWIGKPIAGYSTVRCSCCEEVFLENEGKWNYCPNCGAKMEEEE